MFYIFSRKREEPMQYRSSEIFGRKGKQLRAIHTIEQNHKSVGEERIYVCLDGCVHLHRITARIPKCIPPYIAREMIGEGGNRVVCMSRAGTGRHPLSTFHQHVGHSNPSKYDWLFERWPRSPDDRSL